MCVILAIRRTFMCMYTSNAKVSVWCHPAPKCMQLHDACTCVVPSGAVLHGLVCHADPSPPTSPYTGEPCDYGGVAATKGTPLLHTPTLIT
eukprot:m.1655358 g.1655358  ORF g.1655358 m.1655358 type:complete len:91 (-) comp104055_c0_seq1:169-441(-)